MLHGRKARGQAGRSTPDDDDVERLPVAGPGRLADRIDRLPSLFDGVAHQAHPAQFAGDVDSGHVCLEVFGDIGDVDTACLGAEYECDRVDGANCLARAVADAMRRFNQRCLAANQSDDVAFRAGPYAGAAADAFSGIDHRMQRGRFEQTGLSRRGELRGTVRLAALPRDHVGSPHADHWGGVDNEQIESHANLYRLLTDRLLTASRHRQPVACLRRVAANASQETPRSDPGMLASGPHRRGAR